MSAAPPLHPRRARLRPLATYPVRLGPCTTEFRPTPFSRLAVVHALSSAGDALVTVALAGSVFVSVSLHAARDRTALGLLCTVAPFVLVGPYLGPLVDRVRGGRRAMVAISAVGRAIACIFMATFIHSLLLFPAAFTSLVFSKTYLVSKAALVPAAVERDDDLVQANAKLAVGSSLVTSLAAVVGAGIYRMFGSATVLHLDVVVLAACAVAATRLRPARGGPLGPDPAGPPTVGVGVDRTDPVLPPGGLALAAVCMAGMRAVAGLMTALVVFAFRRDGTPLIWYGLVAVASVGGNLGGAALAPLVRARVREAVIIGTCGASIGAGALAVTQVGIDHRRPAALIFGVVVGVAASVGKLSFDALVQRNAPDAARGRLFAQFESVFQLSWVLAALIPVLLPLGLAAGFVLAAGLTVAGTVVYLLGLRRADARGLPRWWPGVRTVTAGRPPGP